MATIQSSYESASEGNSNSFKQENKLSLLNSSRSETKESTIANNNSINSSRRAKEADQRPEKVSDIDREEKKANLNSGKLSELLARELEAKLTVNEKSGSAATATASDSTKSHSAVTGAVGRSKQPDKSSLLEALLEGKKSWLENKTVIVEIKNGQRIDLQDEGEELIKKSSRNLIHSSQSDARRKSSSSLSLDSDSLNNNGQSSKVENFQKHQNTDSEKLASTKEFKQLIRKLNSPVAVKVGERKKTTDVRQQEEEDSTRKKLAPEVGEIKVIELLEPKESKTKGTKPPTFGSAPSKLTRIPYFNNYFDQTKTLPAETRPVVEATDKIRSSSSLSTSSSASSPSTSSRIPTLIKQKGYSNISNLFPGKPMNIRRGSATAAPQKQQETENTRLRQKVGNLEQHRRQRGSNSFTNLHQPSETNRRVINRLVGPSPHLLNRRNSFADNRYNNNRGSLYSLNSPNSPTNQQTMRRHNSGYSGYGGSVITRSAKPADSFGGRGRPASAAANYMGPPGRQYRSPSTSSLYYGNSGGMGSAGMGSPYYGARGEFQQAVDPDCPVHGRYSPLGANNFMSKSSQQLASPPANEAMAGTDLLYDPYEAPPYYDRQQDRQRYYSGEPLSPSSRSNNKINALNGAYYNNSSRFSVYHSPTTPGGDGLRSSLAPPNEQLRRIIGHQPPTKPIHLHPQWAFTRPFIHLQGRSSTMLRSADDDGISPIDGEPLVDIRPRFEAYNQLHDSQAIRAVDFHPSGEVYAIGSNSRALRICAYPADHELRHFNLETHVTSAPRILFKFLQVHRGSIYCVKFNSSGQLLATGSNDQTVHIVKYNSATHSPDGDEYRLTMHDGTIRDLCFIDDQTNGSSLLLSAGGGDNKIYVTDCDTITPYQSMAGHTQMVMALDHWSGASFVSASYDRTIRFWDLRTRNCTSIVSAPSPAQQGASKYSYGGPGAPVCSVKIDPSGRLLASGHSDATCMLYDIRGCKIIQAYKPNTDEIRTVSFSPKSYYLLTGGYDGRIVLTDLQGDLTQPLPTCCVAENDDKIVQSRWHPSDFTFVTTSADKTATLWALPEGDSKLDYER